MSSYIRTILAGFAVLLAAACNPISDAAPAAPPPPEVTVAHPIVRQIVEDDEFVGRFDAVDAVEIRSRVGGYLAKVHFTDGEMVEQGDLLFTIDQRPFRAALDQAEAQQRVTTAQLDYAKQQYDRGADLVGRGTIAISTQDERNQAFLAAQASMEAAKAATRAAALDLEFTEIRAPSPDGSTGGGCRSATSSTPTIRG